MKNFLLLILLVFFQLGNAQDAQLPEKLKHAIERLDASMKSNNPEIVSVLAEDVSFGHSNGWVQNLSDFKKDFDSKIVVYSEIRQTEISEVKSNKKTYSIRRKVAVSGIYKTYEFKMTLSLLEIWNKQKGNWKLWSRQAIELKNN